MDNLQLVFILLSLLLIVALILLSFGGKSKKDEWQDEIRNRLNKLIIQSKEDNKIIINSTVIEADKLLDHTLKLKGLPGETMGERLKEAKTLYPAKLYDQIWEAHKVRNNLVHEVSFRISDKRALKEFNSLRKGITHLLR